MVEPACAPGRLKGSPLDYGDALVQLLLQVLVRLDSVHLLTLQLMCSLVHDLAYDGAISPCLHQHQLEIIERAYKGLATFIGSQLEGPDGEEALDVFEDAVPLLEAPAPAPLALDPTGVRLLHGPAQGRLRRVSQHFMCVRRLLRHMRKGDGDVGLDPLAEFGSRTSSPLFAPAGVPLKPGAVLEMSKLLKVVPAICGNRREYMLVDPDYFLLVKRHPDARRSAFSIVQTAIPLRHQHPQQASDNPCLLHLRIRARRKPHPCAVREGRASTIAADALEPASYSLKLLLADARQCVVVGNHLRQSRQLLRKQTLTDALALLAMP